MKNVIYALTAATIAATAMADWYDGKTSREMAVLPPSQANQERMERDMAPSHGPGCLCFGCQEVRRREEQAKQERREQERREQERREQERREQERREQERREQERREQESREWNRR